jgi:hypothetical protein
MTGKVKLRTELFAGGVSEMVRLREALPVPPPPPPPPPPLLFRPLQEASGRIARTARRDSILFEFMQTPRLGFEAARGGLG